MAKTNQILNNGYVFLVSDIHNLVSDLHDPVTDLHDPVTDLHDPVTDLHDPVTDMCSLVTDYTLICYTSCARHSYRTYCGYYLIND